jgi:hypothetical protein
LKVMHSFRGVQIQIADPTRIQEWDEDLLSQHPQASPFHGANWARVLQSTYGYLPRFVILKAPDHQRRLLLPLMEVRSWLTGVRGVSLPFTDECRILTTDDSLKTPAFRHLLEITNQNRWRYCELRGAELGGEEIAPSLSFYAHQLRLGPDPAKLFASFFGTVRTSVRKAEQSGVTVEFSTSLEATRTFYSLLCLTRGRHGLPPQPPQFFENIHRYIIQRGQGMVVLAKHGSTAVAGAIFLHLGETAIYKYAASDDRFRNFQGNNLVLWKAIEHYARSNYTMVDFGRTSLTNQGLRRFKLGWSAAERTLNYHRYERATRSFIKAHDQATEGAHTKVFQSLPSALSRLVGKALYRHLG